MQDSIVVITRNKNQDEVLPTHQAAMAPNHHFPARKRRAIQQRRSVFAPSLILLAKCVLEYRLRLESQP